MKTIDEVVALLEERKRNTDVVFRKMQEVRDAYNGDIVIPLPELEKNERAAVANLVNIGIDQKARRISSVMGNVFYPPARPGDEASEARARTARLANLAWWDQNRMKLKMRRRARYIVGYVSTPVLLRPDTTGRLNMPVWNIRHPLGTYPAPCNDPDDVHPDDCIFTYTRTLAWLQSRYPDATRLLSKGPSPTPDTLFEVCEYVDAEGSLMGVLGKPKDAFDYAGANGTAAYLELVPWTENRAGVCPAVVPGRITLDRPMGEFDGVIPSYHLQGKLLALSIIAVQRGVLPEEWLVARANETAEIVVPADPTEGIIGQVQGGTIETIKLDPSFADLQMVDRIERNMRVSAGVPPELGGESGSNIRTGRRGDAILSAAIDFNIQEAQELLAASLEVENRVAAAIDKAYFDYPKPFYMGKGSAPDYTPSETFVSDVNFVRFPNVGTDLGGMIVQNGQKLGLGTMSRRTFMEMDPTIEDVEVEHDRIVSEGLEQALLQGLQQQAVAGAMAPTDIGRVWRLVRSNKMDLDEAVEQVHREAQERQAAQVEPGAPEAQPGLAQPGVGAEAGGGVAQVNEPPDLQRLSFLMSSLHRTAQSPAPAGG